MVAEALARKDPKDGYAGGEAAILFHPAVGGGATRRRVPGSGQPEAPTCSWTMRNEHDGAGRVIRPIGHIIVAMPGHGAGNLPLPPAIQPGLQFLSIPTSGQQRGQPLAFSLQV